MMKSKRGLVRLIMFLEHLSLSYVVNRIRFDQTLGEIGSKKTR